MSRDREKLRKVANETDPSPSASSYKAEVQATLPSSGQAKEIRRAARVAGKSDVAPFIEIKLEKAVRTPARAVADASSSNKRARAPSRKLLEASGLLEDDTAQLMTSKIRQVELKRMREFREQRKHFRAAGLKVGEVIQALDLPQPAAAGNLGGVEDYAGTCDVACTKGDSRGAEWPPTTNTWRTLSSAEMLQATTLGPVAECGDHA